MTTVADVLSLAASQIGYVEVPTNRTKYGQWYGMDGASWCAMFVSWVFYNKGLPLPATISKGFAYTPSGAAWFQRQGRWTHTPAPGHVVFYDFPGDGVNRISHVGIVERINSDGSITAIEGNTSSGSSGSQRNGGGVYRRTRKVGIVGYGVPNWAGGGAPPGPGPTPTPPPTPGATPINISALPTLQQGSTGQAVRNLQGLMHAVGRPTGVDGQFGPGTASTLRGWQAAAGLAADGICGPQTWAHLIASPCPELAQGSRGQYVRNLQGLLLGAGRSVAVDGDFGPGTASVLRGWQSAAGGAADGIAGPWTWHHLIGA